MTKPSKKVSPKTNAFYSYFVHTVSTGTVNADIDLLTSEPDFAMPPWLASWEEATTGEYRVKKAAAVTQKCFRRMSRKECGIFARIPKEGTSEADSFTIEKEEAR